MILEPIMNVEALVPAEFQSATISLLTRKKGVITNTVRNGETIAIHANVALKDMFGFITDLRSATQVCNLYNFYTNRLTNQLGTGRVFYGILPVSGNDPMN